MEKEWKLLKKNKKKKSRKLSMKLINLGRKGFSLCLEAEKYWNIIEIMKINNLLFLDSNKSPLTQTATTTIFNRWWKFIWRAPISLLLMYAIIFNLKITYTILLSCLIDRFAIYRCKPSRTVWPFVIHPTTTREWKYDIKRILSRQ